MHLLENLISAFSILRGSKLRTILTLLGITIGIAGVIAMMSFGAGAEKLMMAEFENIGGPQYVRCLPTRAYSEKQPLAAQHESTLFGHARFVRHSDGLSLR